MSGTYDDIPKVERNFENEVHDFYQPIQRCTYADLGYDLRPWYVKAWQTVSRLWK
jgi:hypothetical protein